MTTSKPPTTRPSFNAPAREVLARVVPGPLLRILAHEGRVMESLIRWVARRPHGVDGADAVFTHGRDQALTMYGCAFACIVETVAVSCLLSDRPVIHSILLVVDVYTVLFVFGMQAATVTRPHVLAEGTLRVRQAANVDIHVPIDHIAAVRREARFTHEKTDGQLNLPIASQTSITLELTTPVNAPKFFGTPRLVNVIRLHADDPEALHDAVVQARTRGTPASA
ncbi:hypothetical protein ACF07Y_35640 [Streptomyces sp. NPDC016566]|uniref:hypothetical protein n=1 Tax=Streptomyces sp. NPDC016566 TaxID=3364967 RepID=UPI003701F0E8